MELLKPTNDYVFKRIFGQKKNSKILKDLLEAILPDLNIKSLSVQQEVQLEKNLISDKIGRLDIVATLDDNTVINVEMQMKDNKNLEERSVFYESAKYHESLKTSEQYTEIPKVIGIWILNYDCFEDDGPYHEIARIRRDYKGKVLTNKFEIHFIQLPKFKRKCKRISTKLEEWLTFISFKNLEELKMIKNKYVKKAEEELEYLSGDAAERRIAELRENAERDYKWAMSAYRADGLAEGLAEGENKGKAEKEIEIAKKMLAKNMDIEMISEITGLTKEEIEKLK